MSEFLGATRTANLIFKNGTMVAYPVRGPWPPFIDYRQAVRTGNPALLRPSSEPMKSDVEIRTIRFNYFSEGNGRAAYTEA